MQSVPCPLKNQEFASLLLEYCDRTLSPDMLSIVERHLDLCEECRGEVAAQQAVWAALDSWRPEPVSTGFATQLLERVERERTPPWARLLGWPGGSATRPAVPLAAAAMVLLMVAVFRGGAPATAPETKADLRPAHELVDVEQVDRSLADIEMLRQFGIDSGAPETSGSKSDL